MSGLVEMGSDIHHGIGSNINRGIGSHIGHDIGCATGGAWAAIGTVEGSQSVYIYVRIPAQEPLITALILI